MLLEMPCNSVLVQSRAPAFSQKLTASVMVRRPLHEPPREAAFRSMHKLLLNEVVVKSPSWLQVFSEHVLIEAISGGTDLWHNHLALVP